MDRLQNKALVHPKSDALKRSSDEISPLKSSSNLSRETASIFYGAPRGASGDSHSDVKLKNGEAVQKNITSPDNSSKLPEAAMPLSLRLLNFALAYFWVGPLVTVYWCNSWHIPEHYLLPQDLVTSAWISGAFGYGVYFMATFFQDRLAAFAVQRGRLVRVSVVQLHSYVMCWASVNQWRFVWVLLDEYTGAGLTNAAVTYLSATVIMVLLRVHRTTVFAPSTIRMDFPVKDHFVITTYFEISSGILYKAVDTLFTIVVDIVGITLWRGLWEMMDSGLTPDQKDMSGLWSLVISYGLAVLLFFTQNLVRKISIGLDNKYWIASLMFEDFITILYTVVAVCHWRGYWTLMDVYLPYKPVSHFVCHFTSFFIIGRWGYGDLYSGCIRDGRLEKDVGIDFDNYYFSHLCKLWMLRKSQIKMAEVERGVKDPSGIPTMPSRDNVHK